MLNVRASFNRLLKAVADAGVQVVLEPHEVEKMTCYKIEWGTAQLPQGANWYARNVRVHLKGSSSGDASPRESTYEIEKRLERLTAGLQLGHEASLASHPLYDYSASPTGNPPPQIGSFIVRRSKRGIDVNPPPKADPGRRHLVLNLVVVYQR